MSAHWQCVIACSISMQTLEQNAGVTVLAGGGRHAGDSWTGQILGRASAWGPGAWDALTVWDFRLNLKQAAGGHG